MRHLLSLFALVFSSLSFAEPAEETVHPRDAVSVRLGTGVSTPTQTTFIGIGSLGGLAFVAPSSEAAISWEHAFGHLSVIVAAGGTMSFNLLARGYAVSVEPGVRWTFGATPLSGPWVGAAVPLSFGESRIEIAGSPRVSTTSSLGVDGLAGWSFRFENGLYVQGALGPRITFVRTESTNGSLGNARVDSGALGVRAFASIGAAF